MRVKFLPNVTGFGNPPTQRYFWYHPNDRILLHQSKMVDEPPEKRQQKSEPTKHVKQTPCLESGPVVKIMGNRQIKGPNLGSKLGFQSSKCPYFSNRKFVVVFSRSSDWNSGVVKFVHCPLWRDTHCTNEESCLRAREMLSSY